MTLPPSSLVAAWAAAFVVAAGATVALTVPLIGWLRSHHIGKTIRADGPAHAGKAGTPTMGGLGMLLVVAVAAVALMRTEGGRAGWEPTVLAFGLVSLVAFALIGALDDLTGIGRLGAGGDGGGIGFSARRMLLAEVACGLVLAWVFRGSGSGLLWAGFAALVIVGTANGVNLSDGLDGLAAGLLVIAFVGQATVIALTQQSSSALLLVAAAGAAAGFLVFNRHPARVFMGNTASLGLGALLGTAAVATETWALLAVVAAVFAAEVGSDIVQIAYFKFTGGKRIFRMAPLHHHFEKGGWPETMVVRRFWLAGALAAVTGVGLALAAG